MPYAPGNKTWSYQQISKYNSNDIYPLLLIAAEKFNDPHYLNAAGGIKKERNDWMIELMYEN